MKLMKFHVNSGWKQFCCSLSSLSLLCHSSSSGQERSEWDSNPDPSNVGEVLYQLSYQANWELVIMCVNDKPADSGYMQH